MRPLPPDGAEVWLAEPDAVDVAAARALLSPDERNKHDRFVFARDRNLYAVAHALLRRALSRYAEVAPADWRFVVDAHGRPAVAAGLPAIEFNLSHTAGLCACIVSRAPAGIDVEAIGDADDPVAIAEHTLKESYVKARGLGLALPLEDFAFTVDDARIEMTPGEDAGCWWFALTAPSPRTRLAVALRRGDVTPPLTLLRDPLRGDEPPEILTLPLLTS